MVDHASSSSITTHKLRQISASSSSRRAGFSLLQNSNQRERERESTAGLDEKEMIS
jgi:hypothetical protein